MQHYCLIYTQYFLLYNILHELYKQNKAEATQYKESCNLAKQTKEEDVLGLSFVFSYFSIIDDTASPLQISPRKWSLSTIWNVDINPSVVLKWGEPYLNLFTSAVNMCPSSWSCLFTPIRSQCIFFIYIYIYIFFICTCQKKKLGRIRMWWWEQEKGCMLAPGINRARVTWLQRAQVQFNSRHPLLYTVWTGHAWPPKIGLRRHSTDQLWATE